MAVTTRYGGNEKSFSWSYSRLKNYEVCPKRYFHVDVTKDWKEEEGEQLKWGNRVHKMFEERLAKGKEFPIDQHDDFEPWALRVLSGHGEIKVEQQLAIDKNFAPCGWFGSQTWYRAKADVIKVHGPVAIVIDWKTGNIVEDSVQLMLTAACVFAHYPEVQVVQSLFVWLKENAETSEIMRREELPRLWSNLWSRIDALRLAHVNTDFPPHPNRLCRKWCPVKICPHNGH